jgi:hypothetical protein
VRAVLVDFATTLPVLDGLSVSERAQLRVAVLTHNLIYRRTELYRERGLPLDFRGLARDEEAALLRRADMIVAIQEREAAEFRKLVPDRSVAVVPMPTKSRGVAFDGGHWQTLPFHWRIFGSQSRRLGLVSP